MRNIELPRGTSFCDESPIVKFGNEKLVIEYTDSESGDTTEIVFESVYGFAFIELEYIDTIDYEFGCVEVLESNLKEQYLKSWELRDRDRKEAFGGESKEVKHYRLYFDDYGMYDVLCKKIRIKLTA